MITVEEFLEKLWQRHNGKRLTILCGEQWGDNAKGAIESALADYFKAFVRVSGGANTGRTRRVLAKDGSQKEFIFHLVPTGWADGKRAIIGDWVLIDLERLVTEIKEIIGIVGQPKRPLHISKKAPIHLRYHSLLETWIEHTKGARAIATTKRGIAPMIAGVDLRIGPLVGHLLNPDWLRQWVKGFYDAFEPIFKEMENQEMIEKLADYHPDKETERLLALVPQVKDYITDVDPILHYLAKKNVPTLFGLTQGFGLHFKGTYPYSSATQTLASAAAYCGGLPMDVFGPVILVSKLLPTRVGAGPFPSGWWDRKAAEQFPKDHPELFSDLTDGQETKERVEFLIQMRDKINLGQASQKELAQYFMVLLNELGASTKRGREVGGPDLYLTSCAAAVNGADCLALTRVDCLSHLRITLPLVTDYFIDGQPVQRPTYPTPLGVLDKVNLISEPIKIDFRGVDIFSLSRESDLPPDARRLIERYESHVGIPVGIISTSPGKDGKIFRDIS